MYNLDKYQLGAVESSYKSTMIVAPPGSGKTTVILNKVNHLLGNGINSKNIIILTFTKSAAEDMKKRFENKFDRNDSPFFGTFHGLFYKLLIRYHGKLDIINSYEAFSLIKKILGKFSEEVSDDKIKEVLNNISLKKSSIYDDFKPSIANDIFDACYMGYEEYKEYKNLLDFDDLQIRAINLLRTNENILNGYKNLFKYILVDEFQDCDNLQIEFLHLMNTSIFCVGDEDQCIYSFRGSNPQIIVDFEKEFENPKKLYLKYNYRSNENIVNTAKIIIDDNKNRDNKDIVAYKKTNGEIELKVPYDESEQSKMISSKIKERYHSGFNYSDNAILYRTNVESRSVIDRLIKEKIPFRLLDKEFNFFNHFICQDIISYLKLALDPTDKESFIRVINKPYRYVSKGVIQGLKNERECVNCFDFLIASKETHPFQIKKLEDLKNDIASLNKLTLRTAIDFILSDLDYLDHVRDYSNKYNQKTVDLLDIMEEFKEAAKEFNKIIPFFKHIKDVEENIEVSKKINQDSVILSTIHGVKGMEFKNVYIIDCVEEFMPHKSASDIEEERRIFYVGITRAIDNLSLYSPKFTKGSNKLKTIFLRDKNTIRYDEYTGGFKIGQKVYSKTNGSGSVEEVKDGIVTIIFGNVLKRFDIKTVIESNLIEIKK